MTWPNHLPQYMHNFQGPLYPPYQGYLFPGMQMPPPYYPGNMQWQSNAEDSSLASDREPDGRRNSKSHRNKKKLSHKEVSRTSEQEGTTESSVDSDSDEHSEDDKKQYLTEKIRKKRNSKKSSRTVVIRNINYITSKRNGEKGSHSEDDSSDEGELIDGDSIKQQVEEAVGTLERRHKSTNRHQKKQNGFGNADDLNDSAGQEINRVSNEGEKMSSPWDTFQNLLMRDEPDNHGGELPSVQDQDGHFRTNTDGRSLILDMESEKPPRQREVSSDSFVVTDRNSGNEGRTHIENFEAGDIANPINRKRDSTYEELLFSQRGEEAGNNGHSVASDFTTEFSRMKNQREGDWFVGNPTDKSDNQYENIGHRAYDVDFSSSLPQDHFHAEKNKKDVLVDDSFMIHARPLVDDQSDFLSRRDISMVSDLVGDAKNEYVRQETSRDDKPGTFGVNEPDDLYMILDRDVATEHTAPSWTPEMDYENSFSTIANSKHNDIVETNGGDIESPGLEKSNKNKETPGGRVPSKEGRSKSLGGSLVKGKPDVQSRTRKPLSGSRTTVQKSKFEKVF